MLTVGVRKDGATTLGVEGAGRGLGDSAGLGVVTGAGGGTGLGTVGTGCGTSGAR